jgi:riboflavin synthase
VFTGIVEEVGTVTALRRLDADSARLDLRAPQVTGDLRPGESVAVNGVCLTAVTVADGAFTADVMRETLDRTALGGLGPGSPVNLERALAVGARLGGHLVQGHVDGTATVLDRRAAGHGELVRVGLPPALARYVVEKGSVTVDGVSLTVAAVDGESFSVGLIPTTLAHTTLGAAGPGTRVNLEVDVLAKYVEKMLQAQP